MSDAIAIFTVTFSIVLAIFLYMKHKECNQVIEQRDSAEKALNEIMSKSGDVLEIDKIIMDHFGKYGMSGR